MKIEEFRVGTIIEETQRYPFDKNFRGIIKLTEEDVRSIFEHGWFKGYKPVEIIKEDEL